MYHVKTRIKWLKSPKLMGSLLALLSIFALAVPLGGTASAAGRIHVNRVQTNFADPGFQKFGSYYYLYKTGTGFNYSRSKSPASGYSKPRNAMPNIPSWVAPDDSKLWAPDVFQSKEDGKTIYVMYFTGRVKGTKNHCVGTAKAAHPYGPFHATGTKICADKQGYSTIDPSHYQGKDGQQYIVFKQNKGNIKGFKIVVMKMYSAGLAPITKDGRHTAISTGDGADSRIEAPSVIHHGNKVWIFNSRGNYVDCSYSTDVWSADTLWGSAKNFKRVKSIMTTKSTGLCGPGGATVMQDGKTTRIAFHAWVGGTNGDDGAHRDAWVGELHWDTGGKPFLY